MAAQQLGDGEHEIGGRRPRRERADQLDADDTRQQHRERLSEHRGFGFDAAHSPTENAETVHHRRVRVGADERVGIHEIAVAAEHDLREVLEVHLVADPAVRREHAQRAERGLRPPQEGVALAVACELELRVLHERVGDARDVGDDRMVDDEVDRDARLDQARGAAEGGHRVAHRREVDDRGHAGEVLHQHTRGHELQLARPRLDAGAGAIRERGDVVGADVLTVLVAEQVLQHDAQRVRQRVRVAHDRAEPVEVVGPVTDGDVGARPEAVERH